jgi:hypothetical protein
VDEDEAVATGTVLAEFTAAAETRGGS